MSELKITDLPLSEARHALIQDVLRGDVPINQRHGVHTIAWGENKGLLRKVGAFRWEVTELGRQALEVSTKHSWSVRPRLLGHGPQGGNRYGTTLTCRCKWESCNNEAPSIGGQKQARYAHREHVATELAKLQEAAA